MYCFVLSVLQLLELNGTLRIIQVLQCVLYLVLASLTLVNVFLYQVQQIIDVIWSHLSTYYHPLTYKFNSQREVVQVLVEQDHKQIEILSLAHAYVC